ncbi:MAG TPA: Hsp20/alpha crystallin family protein [Gemmatimonadales bacterium]|nr:Hsp20/alpha crystallin family protein [Gemmatimonadales bacterium]
MKVTKVAPVVNRVRDEFDRLFDRMLATPFLTEPLPQLAFPMVGEYAAEWTPALDFFETDKEYVIRLDLPGIHKENIDLKLVGELLTIVGRREEAKEYRAGTALWKEREAGKFVRTIRLPAPVEEKKVEAIYQDGILTVTLPKAAAAVGEKILIK